MVAQCTAAVPNCLAVGMATVANCSTRCSEAGYTLSEFDPASGHGTASCYCCRADAYSCCNSSYGYDTHIPSIECAVDRTEYGGGAIAMLVLVIVFLLGVVIFVPLMYARKWGPFDIHNNPHARMKEWEFVETVDA